MKAIEGGSKIPDRLRTTTVRKSSPAEAPLELVELLQQGVVRVVPGAEREV